MQIAAGRVAALQAMKQELLSQAAAAFSEDTAVYRYVVTQPVPLMKHAWLLSLRHSACGTQNCLCRVWLLIAGLCVELELRMSVQERE